MAISWDDVEALLADLDGVRRSGHRWTLDGRLVAREYDATTLLVRADLERGSVDALGHGLTEAVELQRRGRA